MVGCFRRRVHARKCLATFDVLWSRYRTGLAVAGWTMDGSARENRGNTGTQTDFELLEEFLLRIDNSIERQSIAEEVMQVFKDIFKAVQVSWGRMVPGLRVFRSRYLSFFIAE